MVVYKTQALLHFGHLTNLDCIFTGQIHDLWEPLHVFHMWAEYSLVFCTRVKCSANPFSVILLSNIKYITSQKHSQDQPQQSRNGDALNDPSCYLSTMPPLQVLIISLPGRAPDVCICVNSCCVGSLWIREQPKVVSNCMIKFSALHCLYMYEINTLRSIPKY